MVRVAPMVQYAHKMGSKLTELAVPVRIFIKMNSTS